MGFFRKKKLEGKTAQEWLELAFRETDPEMRVRYYSKCLEIAPNRADAWFNMGEALRNLRRYKEAINCFDKALEINPKDKFICRAVWPSKGGTLLDLGRYEEAVICYDNALKHDSKSPVSVFRWNNKGVALNRLGRYAEAIRCFDEALNINPEDEAAKSNKKIAEEKLRQEKVK